MFLENVWLQGRKVLYQVVFQLLNVFFNLYSHWLNLCEKTTYFIYVYSKLHKKIKWEAVMLIAKESCEKYQHYIH